MEEEALQDRIRGLFRSIGERLLKRAEKLLKKPPTIVLDETPPLALLKQGRLLEKKEPIINDVVPCSDSLSKQERLRREKLLKKPMIHDDERETYSSHLLPPYKNRGISKGIVISEPVFEEEERWGREKARRNTTNGIVISEPGSKEDRLRREKALKKPMIHDDETDYSFHLPPYGISKGIVISEPVFDEEERWRREKARRNTTNGTVISEPGSKADRLRREKALKKPMIDKSETPPPLPLPWLKQGSSECSYIPTKKKRMFSDIAACSDSLSKQENLKREKLLIKKPEQPKKRTQSKKETTTTTTTKITYRGPAIPPDIPIEFKNKINEMGGAEIQLIIQKPLYTTDLNHNHGRLSIPLSQIIAKNFLRSEEYAFLNKQSKGHIPSIDVGLIDTRLEIGGTCFKRWSLKKENGKINPTYVLTSTWNDLVDSNNLNYGDILQVWSFRVNGQLQLALVLVQKGADAAAAATATATAEEGSGGVNDTGIGSSSSSSRSKEDTQEQE